MSLWRKLIPKRNKDSNIKQLLLIFWLFLKISPVSFGGGYSLIPVIEKEVVHKRGWMNSKDISDVFSLAQSAPGAIALNSSIFIGYKLNGKLGALAALIGIMLPTFLLMLLLSTIFVTIQANPKIEAAFQAIRTTIVALIVYAAYRMGKEAIIDFTSVIIAISTVVSLYFFSDYIHPVLVIVSGAVLGMLISIVRSKKRASNNIIKKIFKKSNDKDSDTPQSSPNNSSYSDYMI